MAAVLFSLVWTTCFVSVHSWLKYGCLVNYEGSLTFGSLHRDTFLKHFFIMYPLILIKLQIDISATRCHQQININSILESSAIIKTIYKRSLVFAEVQKKLLKKLQYVSSSSSKYQQQFLFTTILLNCYTSTGIYFPYLC